MDFNDIARGMIRDTISTLFRTGRTTPRAAIAAMLLAIACALGGCASNGAAGGSFAMAGAAPTVAFESIDGPPPPIFHPMVAVLHTESTSPNLPTLPPHGPPPSPVP